jgi:hypothetical protein
MPEAYGDLLRGLLVLVRARFDVVKQEGNVIHCEYAAGPLHVAGYLQVNPEARAILLRIVVPVNVMAERRALLAEFIARVNYDIPIGGWVMSPDTGEVRWKSGLYFGEELPPPDMLVALVDSSKAFFYQYVFGITRLMTQGTVEEAMAEIGSDHGQGRLR